MKNRTEANLFFAHTRATTECVPNGIYGLVLQNQRGSVGVVATTAKWASHSHLYVFIRARSVRKHKSAFSYHKQSALQSVFTVFLLAYIEIFPLPIPHHIVRIYLPHRPLSSHPPIAYLLFLPWWRFFLSFFSNSIHSSLGLPVSHPGSLSL